MYSESSLTRIVLLHFSPLIQKHLFSSTSKRFFYASFDKYSASNMAICFTTCGLLALAVAFATVSFDGIDATTECYVCPPERPECLRPTDDMKKPCSEDSEAFCWKSVTTVGSGQAASRGCGKYQGQANVQVGDNECKDTDVKGAKVTVCNCNKSGCNGDHLINDLLGSR